MQTRVAVRKMMTARLHTISQPNRSGGCVVYRVPQKSNGAIAQVCRRLGATAHRDADICVPQKRRAGHKGCSSTTILKNSLCRRRNHTLPPAGRIG